MVLEKIFGKRGIDEKEVDKKFKAIESRDKRIKEQNKKIKELENYDYRKLSGKNYSEVLKILGVIPSEEKLTGEQVKSLRPFFSSFLVIAFSREVTFFIKNERGDGKCVERIHAQNISTSPVRRVPVSYMPDKDSDLTDLYDKIEVKRLDSGRGGVFKDEEYAKTCSYGRSEEIKCPFQQYVWLKFEKRILPTEPFSIEMKIEQKKMFPSLNTGKENAGIEGFQFPTGQMTVNLKLEKGSGLEFKDAEGEVFSRYTGTHRPYELQPSIIENYREVFWNLQYPKVGSVYIINFFTKSPDD